MGQVLWAPECLLALQDRFQFKSLPRGEREQAVRAEKPLVPIPSLVGVRTKAHREQNPLVRRQVGKLFQPAMLGLEFFFVHK